MSGRFPSLRIPLLEISGIAVRGALVDGFPQGLKCSGSMEVSRDLDLPENCYALRFAGGATGGETVLGIFGTASHLKAREGIHVVGLAGREPRICTLVKDSLPAESPSNINEAPEVSPSARVNRRRKSFMTPTPLHVPDSRVSPIPESAHERIFLKGVTEGSGLIVIPRAEVVWMHPLIKVISSAV